MNAPGDFAYIGAELELFAQAHNWKRYWSSVVERYLFGDVLEVGAGIGANTALLRSSRQARWVCLEPDRQLLRQLEVNLNQHHVENRCELFAGTLADLDAHEKFDVILYIDVLEHISDDRAELGRAVTRLKPNGRIIVLSPAHPWLFSPFDAAIGHCRRYTRKTLSAAAPATVQLERSVYLDSVGFCASLANRLLLRQKLPTVRQILFWDRMMVPFSRILDPFLFFHFGKSIVSIWRLGQPAHQTPRYVKSAVPVVGASAISMLLFRRFRWLQSRRLPSRCRGPKSADDSEA